MDPNNLINDTNLNNWSEDVTNAHTTTLNLTATNALLATVHSNSWMAPNISVFSLCNKLHNKLSIVLKDLYFTSILKYFFQVDEKRISKLHK